ncbi:MAG: UDP-N-acetylmuramoyl-L-alanine--D-glutamate ligase [Bacteroidales bacterium]|nr:UDP-N-acetylmuramoyl-L-alanine--D-glutamate ligase [Bacteroidales bacterium]
MTKIKRIVILGAAESGLGAAILARKKGFDVFISDFGIIKPKYKETLDRYGLNYEEGQHTEDLILNATEVIKSPGIAEKTPIVKKIRENGIPIISEIEFAGRYTDAKKICITGSNGKTTTTTLLYHMLRKAGLNVGLAGNVGKSFAWSVAEEDFDYYVIELSSFQLDGMYDFRADIAILLNITPDHLDRYEYNLQNYINSKFRITQNLTKDQFFIFCSDDDVTIRELEKIVLTSQKLPFSVKHTHRPGAFVENNSMIINYHEDDFTMSLEELSLKGKHNTYNSMAAGIAAKVLEIRKEVIRESLTDFQGVEHRLEYVLKIHGVDYINDSKATNVNSTWYALECQSSKIVWIAGGLDKGNDYSELYDLVKEKVKALICLGKDNTKLLKAFEGIAPVIVDTHSIADAVKAAYKQAKNGDVVLLSPACASFDLFDNYEDRGRQFKETVREL